ncbi:MAG: transcription antitermination factor NusB [Bdellovibrionota bacterium]
MSQLRPEPLAREFSLKFLYQCESEKLYYFSHNHFNSFFSYFSVPGNIQEVAHRICEGVFNKLGEIDNFIEKSSNKWKLSRMSVIDRTILRIGTYELLESDTPTKVILNEAVNLAKTYGTEHSGRFVNGLLDALAQRLRKAS